MYQIKNYEDIRFSIGFYCKGTFPYRVQKKPMNDTKVMKRHLSRLGTRQLGLYLR